MKNFTAFQEEQIEQLLREQNLDRNARETKKKIASMVYPMEYRYNVVEDVRATYGDKEAARINHLFWTANFPYGDFYKVASLLSGGEDEETQAIFEEFKKNT